MKTGKIINSLSCALLLAGVSTTLFAEQEGQNAWDEPWRFNAKIHGWLPNAPATIKIDQTEVANLPESFSNILDDLKMAAMFEVEADKGPLGFFSRRSTIKARLIGGLYTHDKFKVNVDPGRG